MTTHIFGIRHHGPGSARSLRRALEDLRPDIVLVEGPPDAADVLPLLAQPDMQPPVALLIYAHEVPRLAVYYPFAVFSPEWQAMRYALTSGIPLRFMDLPQRHQMGVELALLDAPAAPPEGDPAAAPAPPEPPQPAEAEPTGTTAVAPEPQPAPINPQLDPIGALAEAAGYSDGERWWEQMVEQRSDAAGLFEAIQEAMATLRDGLTLTDPIEIRREAWMRQTIRQAVREGFQRIAIVCGAWHGPALVDLSNAAADGRILKGMPSVDVRATWVPWTYGRLSYRSGYGAGIESPGWYEHMFTVEAAVGPGRPASDRSFEITVRWMARVAQLLRGEGLDASSAHVIEAVRLAETLASMRGRSLPGLLELNEASQAVFCFGSDLPMRLIHDRLIVGERLGEVPEATPLAPLQQDLARLQKRLRLPAKASWEDKDLDLRNQTDLERSRLLHRLNLLKVSWGKLQGSSGKGTFRELWRLEWQPELSVGLIEAGIWGNTIADAAEAFARDAANRAAALPELTQLVDQALLADLPDAVAHLMRRIQDEAAVSSDIDHLMDALPPLANVLRYGNVRRTDTDAVAHVVDGMVTRAAIGLPSACAGLNDDAAAALFGRIVKTSGAVGLLQNEDLQAVWHSALRRVADLRGCHGLVAGRAVRLLLDAGVLNAGEAAQRLGLALSTAADPPQAAAWVEGLIKDSGTLLIHDDGLWSILDGWLMGLGAEAFTYTLPLLRRTFSSFNQPERRALGERARKGPAARVRRLSGTTDSAPFDPRRAEQSLDVVGRLLGINT
ncbi:MAG: DUF5682 family protein [Roseiflexaceae bacterium]